MSRADRIAPPQGGLAPPPHAHFADEVVELGPLARKIARRHRREFPDEAERYGDAGAEWCAHDAHWLLAWAALDAGGERGLLRDRVAWLAELLAARAYPIDRLARTLEIAADVAERQGEKADAVVDRLRAAARSL